MSNRITWLGPGDPADAFPPVEAALNEPDGLLAAGGDLSSERLLYAYRKGIFPWYDEGQPLLWWSPDPRCVLHARRLAPVAPDCDAISGNRRMFCASTRLSAT